MTPITIGGHTRWNRLLRGIVAALSINRRLASLAASLAVFAHACKMGLEGSVSKRKDSTYRSGRSPDWLKMKNLATPEAEEDWGRKKWR